MENKEEMKKRCRELQEEVGVFVCLDDNEVENE